MIEYYSPRTCVAASLGVTATSTSNNYNNNNNNSCTSAAAPAAPGTVWYKEGVPNRGLFAGTSALFYSHLVKED